MDTTTAHRSEQRPFHVGQKVRVTFHDHDGEHDTAAWITLVTRCPPDTK